MALEIFLKLGDIAGDSTDAAHPGEITVLSWDWGLTQTAAPLGGGGGSGAAVGKTEFRRLRFAHRIDSASPLIMLACATGRRLKEATLVMRRAGAPPFEFLSVRMSDVTVTLVEPAVNGDKGETYELVALDWTKIEVSHVSQDADGSAGTPTRFGWDIRANKPIP